MQGIDVSSHNPPQNWQERIESGIAFAGVRVTYGTARDVAAEAHLTAAHAAGLRLLLGYHYLTIKPAVDQARAFLDRVAEMETLLGCELALAVDLEDLPGSPPWPREAYERAAREFIEAVKAAKRRPVGVYISPAFAKQLDLSWWFADCPLWLARWAPTPGLVPKPWTSITLWQNAVKDALDRDVFAGTADDFRRVFGLGAAVAPMEAWGNVVRISDAVRAGEEDG